MKNTIITLVVLVAAGVGIYYVTQPKTIPTTTQTTTIPPTSNYQNSVAGSSTPDVSNVATSSQAVLTANVTIKNFSFSPNTLRVQIGTKVTWVNNDSASHTVTSLTSAGLASGSLNQGESYSYTFSTKGTFKYKCNFHPSMLGTVVVTD